MKTSEKILKMKYCCCKCWQIKYTYNIFKKKIQIMKIKLSNLRIQLNNKLFSLNNLKKYENDKISHPPPPSPVLSEIHVIDDYDNYKKNIPELILQIPTIQEAAGQNTDLHIVQGSVKKTIDIDEWEKISNESIDEYLNIDN